MSSRKSSISSLHANVAKCPPTGDVAVVAAFAQGHHQCQGLRRPPLERERHAHGEGRLRIPEHPVEDRLHLVLPVKGEELHEKAPPA